MDLIPLEEFNRLYPTEESARLEFYKMRWGKRPLCINCGYSKLWCLQGKQMQCSLCRTNFTVRTGTILGGTYLKFRLILKAYLTGDYSGMDNRSKVALRKRILHIKQHGLITL